MEAKKPTAQQVRDAAAAEGLYCIPAARRGKIDLLIAKVNWRGSKLGCSPVTAVKVRTDFGEDQVREINGVLLAVPRIRVSEFDLYRVEGEPPGLKGWQLVAAIDHLPGEDNLIQRVPSFEGEIPEHYRRGPQRCDHCKLTIPRKRTFVMLHEDGQTMEVGRNCLVDFFGVPVDRMVSNLEFWSELRGLSEADSDYFGEGGGSRDFSINPRELIYWTIRVVKREGWMSRKAADELMRTPTVDNVLRVMYPSHRNESDLKYARSFEPEDDDSASYREAEEALTWARNLREGDKALSDYEHNLTLVAGLEYIPGRHAGLLCSLLPTFRREMGRVIEREHWAKADPETKWLGQPKAKIEFDGEVSFVREMESNWGTTTLIKLIASTGHQVVWFSSRPMENVELRNRYHVKATVKGHDVYDGRPQTTITRATLTFLTRREPTEETTWPEAVPSAN